MSEAIRISEIFGPTIQGEGALIGQPTVFVRTGGCDYRCSWCDTLHAVESKYRDSWNPMSADEIMREVERLSGGKPLMVTLSGGNPAIQPLGALIEKGHQKGYTFALETQGSVAQDWFAELDMLTLSPKPPSSGIVPDLLFFDECVRAAKDGPDIAMKIVVFDDDDYKYARDMAKLFPQLPLYLQPGNHKVEGDAEPDILNERMRWLVGRAEQDQWYEATILPQLHVMLWGNAKGV